MFFFSQEGFFATLFKEFKHAIHTIIYLHCTFASSTKIRISLFSIFHRWILSAGLPESSLLWTSYSSTPSFTFLNTMLVVLYVVDAVVCIDCHLLPLACKVVPTSGLFQGCFWIKLKKNTEHKNINTSETPTNHQHWSTGDSSPADVGIYVKNKMSEDEI